jgi:hypothetical protein
MNRLFNFGRAARVALALCLLAILPCALFAMQTSTAAPAAAPITLAAKVLGIATGVFALLQALKTYLFPGISGNAAVAFNLIRSLLAVIVAVPSTQLFTGTTLLALLTTIASSSGLHGIWQTLFGGGSTSQVTASSTAAVSTAAK